MHSIMKVRGDIIMQYTDGSITITESSGYTRDVHKDNPLHTILTDLFKMRALIARIDAYDPPADVADRALLDIQKDAYKLLHNL